MRCYSFFFFFSSRRRHTRCLSDWSSDVCSSDLRQPEFTQIDIETSFLDRDDLLPIIEGLVAEIFRRAKGLELARPFRRLAWDEAIRRYGSDKPDLRFGLELRDCSTLFRDSAFQVFAQAVARGGAVQALTVPGAAFSRKDLDDLV